MAKQVRLISLLCNRTGASLIPAGSPLHHLLIDLQQFRCQHPARLLISYGGPLNEAASPQQQFKVLKPAGGGRPVLRSPVFAVVELGAAQYKVSAGDLVIAERLKGLDVGAEILLERVQAGGSQSETLIGRPYVEGTSVTATVEVGAPPNSLRQVRTKEQCWSNFARFAGAAARCKSNQLQEEEAEKLKEDKGPQTGISWSCRRKGYTIFNS